MANPVVVRVHETAVLRYILPGGEVYGAVDGVIEDARDYAKMYAPIRTGALWRNIRHASPSNRAGYKISGYIYANISYARYVNEGTVGPITSKSGKDMHFRTNLGKGPWVSAKSVSGQRPQRFMERGLTTAMVKFRAGG